MTAGPTALHVFAAKFAERAEAATGGAVRVRLFPSGTLGQEREVVQQLQEGLVDFMVSGSAIWGSVAPRLQLLDFPFLWRDWDHVHRIVDGPMGLEVADYLDATVRMRPLAWGDSFGFRQLVTRSRHVNGPADLAGLKIRTIQSSIYLKTIELLGASPTPMAFGEVYTSLQTGVIDGYEHDASTTLQQRFYEVAHVMTRTRHIAGVLGLWGSRVALARLPTDLRTTLEQAARDAAHHQRQVGPAEEAEAAAALASQRMTIRRVRQHAVPSARRAALGLGRTRARRDALARGHPRVSGPVLDSTLALSYHPSLGTQGEGAVVTSRVERALLWATAGLVFAQAAVVGLQVVGRHLLHRPIPWTEEVARLLLVWLMCAGGVLALKHAHHPRVTAVLRLFPEPGRRAIDRGLRLVLIGLFLSLLPPSWRLTIASIPEQLPASGLSGATMSIVLPVALVLMTVVLVEQVVRDGWRVWCDRSGLLWSAAAIGVTIASVGIPIVLGAPPLVVLVLGFLTTAALGVPLAFTLVLTSFTYLIGIGGIGLIILPIKILGGVDSFVLLAIPLFILGGALMESAGISQRIVDLAMAIVGRIRGGLAMVVVVAEVIFSGISGSTAADVSAISSLLVPSMKKAGYSGPESVSIVAAASAMGILVPPCLTMVVLGSLVNLSIVTLFLAGFVPALLLAGALLVLIAIRARRQHWPIAESSSRAELGRVLRRAGVPLGLPLLLFGGIFSGATTVTEAALLAVVYALVVELWIGEVRPSEAVARFAQSGIVTATTLWVLAAASAFAWVLVREWVPQALGEWISGIGAGPVGFMALTIVVFVLIGALLEGLPALLIFGPILYPISRTVGIDPVHYGIVIVAAMGIAFFLPPVGVGLAIASGIGRVDIDEVSRAYVPYLVTLLIGLVILAAFPFFTLVLPRLVLGYGS